MVVSWWSWLAKRLLVAGRGWRRSRSLLSSSLAVVVVGVGVDVGVAACGRWSLALDVGVGRGVEWRFCWLGTLPLLWEPRCRWEGLRCLVVEDVVVVESRASFGKDNSCSAKGDVGVGWLTAALVVVSSELEKACGWSE